MRKSTILMLIASIAIVGCQKFQEGHGCVDSSIKPNVKATMLLRSSTTVNSDNLDKFKMIAVSSEGLYFTSYAKKNGSWDLYDSASSSSPISKNWINDSNIAFWSWYPFDSDVNGTLTVTTPDDEANALAFSYELPAQSAGSDASNQQDLVFAGNIESRTFDEESGEIKGHSSSNTSYNRNDNQFDIVFHHPLSKIMFGVDVNDGTFNKNLVINSIELENIFSKGDCSFSAPSSFTWGNWSVAKKYSQSYGADFSGCTGASGSPEGWTFNSESGLNVCDNCFFLIPQDFAGVKINIGFALNGITLNKSATLSGDGQWAPDHYYIYKIKAQGEGDETSFSVSLFDWSQRENYIPID